MSTSTAVRPRSILVTVIAVLIVVVTGLVLPGLGLVTGTGMGLLAYRDDRRKMWGFIVLGVVVTLVAVLLSYLVTAKGGHSSTFTTVQVG